jgi:hypothetical protein
VRQLALGHRHAPGVHEGCDALHAEGLLMIRAEEYVN